jgi:hypothetical protein
MSNLYSGPSIDASYQVSVHLTEVFQRRRLKCEKLMDDRRRTTDAKWWQKLTLPLARWAKKRRNTEQYTSIFFQIKINNETENPELKANNTESLIICHCAFSFIVIVCCKKSKVFSCRVLGSVIFKLIKTSISMSLKVSCDIKSPQTTFTTCNIRAGSRSYAGVAAEP